MKVKPYFKASLTEPFQGKFYHEKGASVMMNTEVHTKSIGNFLVVIPDPVSLNLNNAQNFIDKCSKLKERINSSKQFTIFSKILSEETIHGLTTEEIKELDPEALVLRKLDDEKIFEYMQGSMGVVVSLITAVESFLNLVIPHDYIIKKLNKLGQSEILDKEKIVRKSSIEDKLSLIAEIKNVAGMKQEPFWTTFKTVKNLRDEIVHFKITNQNISLIWNPTIVSFFDSDLQQFLDHTVALINYIEPTY